MHASTLPIHVRPARPAGTAAVAIHRAAARGRAHGRPALKVERHDATPGGKVLPAGAEEHLVFISLGRGHVELEHGGETIRRELSPGSMAVCPAGVPIRWKWPTPLSYTVLALDPAFLNQVAGRIYGAAPGDFELLPTECKHDFGIASLLDPLVHEARRAGADRNLYLESLANVLAVHLLRHYCRWVRGGPRREPPEHEFEMGRATRVPEPVQRAVRYIEAHHARDIGLRDIAEAAHYSPYHLARLFKQSMGLPPHRYLIQVRVRSAHALLSMGTGRPSLAEIAAASGFSDQSHLTRHYKRALGVTPGQVTVSTTGRLIRKGSLRPPGSSSNPLTARPRETTLTPPLEPSRGT
jgi:AraC family transcriptional regulator